MTITEFLLARIAEDEVEAKWVDAEGDNGSSPVQHPARILAECEAKRAIIEDWQPLVDEVPEPADAGWAMASDRAVRALATIYSDHPDYNPDWAL